MKNCDWRHHSRATWLTMPHGAVRRTFSRDVLGLADAIGSQRTSRSFLSIGTEIRHLQSYCHHNKRSRSCESHSSLPHCAACGAATDIVGGFFPLSAERVECDCSPSSFMFTIPAMRKPVFWLSSVRFAVSAFNASVKMS